MPGSWSDFLKLRSGPAPPPSSEAGAVRVYADNNGALRSIQSDGTDAAIGGGGSTPVTERGLFVGGDEVTIGNGALVYLTWSDGGYPGGPVLDLTDPLAPAVLAAGIYDVTASVEGISLTPDGFFSVQLILDANGDSAVVLNESRLATAARPNVFCAVSCSYYIPAGGTIQVRVTNFDGASSRVFENHAVTVQRAT